MEWFIGLTTQECYLCGAPPSQAYRHDKNPAHSEPFYYNGIDRVDNSMGYVSGNLYACCKTCNYAKGQLTLEQFLIHVAQIYELNFKEDESGQSTI